MSRTYTTPDEDSTAPELDPLAVAAFFEARAGRIDELGPTKAVIYQDKHGNLAEQRDQAEARCLMPRLRLNGLQRFLDVGCGTGRWAARLVGKVAAYHGIDLSEGLLDYARTAHAQHTGFRFSRLAAEGISSLALGETAFDRMLCSGVSIYLNDGQLDRMLLGMGEVASRACLIVLREPVGIQKRLTLIDHWSEELELPYHATYRTEQELIQALDRTLGQQGFAVRASGDVYEDPAMNNRPDTRQRWLAVERVK